MSFFSIDNRMSNKLITPLVQEDSISETIEKEPENKEEYQLRFDGQNCGMQTGAADLLTTYMLLTRGLDHLFDKTDVENNWFSRSLKLAFPVFQLAYHTNLIDHEVFGHGARGREFGLKDDYTFKFFSNGLLTSGSYNPVIRYNKEKALVLAGGLEGTQVMADLVARSFFSSSQLNYREAMLYLANKIDFSGYAFHFWGQDQHDTKKYLFCLNRIYHLGGDYLYYRNNETNGDNSDDPEKVIVKMGTEIDDDMIKLAAAINMLDPNVWLGAYQIYQYIKEGRKEIDVPNIMPRVNVVLTLCGPEAYFTLPYRTEKGDTIEAYLRSTINDSKDLSNYWGAGIGAHYKFNLGYNIIDSIEIGSSAHIWQNPTVKATASTEEKEIFPLKNYPKIGSALSTNAKLNSGNQGFGIDLLYKTKGRLLGQPEDEGLVVSGTYQISF